MPRSVMLFNRAGVKNLIPVPVGFKSSSLTPLTIYKLFPTYYWLRDSAIALREYFGLIYYSFKK
jgi:uncharacterized SAM-binding protein YcdF (DUF218 family)